VFDSLNPWVTVVIYINTVINRRDKKDKEMVQHGGENRWLWTSSD
jgi:hypothetical protein